MLAAHLRWVMTVLCLLAVASCSAAGQMVSNSQIASGHEAGLSTSRPQTVLANGVLPLQFAPGVQYSSGGTRLYGIASGDLNNDGKPDLVVTNEDQNNVAVLLGNGDGTFQTAVPYTLIDGSPYGVAVADFNGDNKADVAVVNGATYYVSILLGHGDGTLGPPMQYGPGSSSINIATADVNGDHKVDLLLGGNGAATILLGNGDGSFRDPIYLENTLDAGPIWSCAAADVNGDGRVDIIGAVAYPEPGIAVFLQSANGSFTDAHNYLLSSGEISGWGVAIADLNGDGNLDVVASLTNGEAPTFLGNGDGTFQPPIRNYSGTEANTVVLADFDKDGVPDVAFGDYADLGALVSLGLGDGHFYVDQDLAGAGGTTGIAVADFNRDGWLDIASADSTTNVTTVFLNVTGSPLQFVPTTPCRVVDTRGPNGEFGGPPIQGGRFRSFALPDNIQCNIPARAVAFSLNVTAAPHGHLGYLTIWPEGPSRPVISTLNSPDGRTKANAAIVPAGSFNAVSVYVTDTSDVILDIDGYFTTAGPQTYQFYPLAPCRVIDTRGPVGDLGGPYLHGGRSDGSHRDFPVRGSDCIPANANVAAYSLNFTVAPHVSGQRLGYLTVWPEGSDQPLVSTLNNPTATVVANAAIVPAGANGGISVFAYDDTDMIADINGYFGPAGQGGYSFYPAAPCRAYDSRDNNGQPFRGTRVVNIAGSPCAPPATARGYVFNATVVPDHGHPMGYLTLWPDGENMPFVSTLNAYDGLVTSNMAIVPNDNGSIDAYADGLTHLILDISGYFAP